MTENYQLLLVEDNPGEVRLIQQYLKNTPLMKIDLKVVDTLEKAQKVLDEGTIDAILLDLGLSDSTGIETFKQAIVRSRSVPIIVLSGVSNNNQATEAINNGAQDYLVKDSINTELLVRSIRYAIHRNLSKRELEKSEQKYRNLIEQMHDGYLILQDSKVAFANQIIADMFGYTLNEFVGLPFTDLVASEDLEMISEGYQRRVAGEPLKERYDVRAIRKDGTQFIGFIGGSPFEFNGKPATLTTLIDVTERRKLEQGTQYLASLIGNVSEAIISTDEKFIIRSWNEAAEKIYGWKSDEAIGKPLLEILQPESDSTAISMNELLETGKWERKSVHRSKDDKQIRVKISASLLSDKDGNQYGTVAVISDITEQKEVENALKESELRNRTIADSMSDIVFVYDSEGKHSEFYGHNESLLVRPWSEIKGKAPEEVVSQDIAEQHKKNIDELRKTGENVSYEYQLETDGILRWFRGIMMSHEDKESIVVAIKDITEQKESEISLRQSEEKYRSLWHNSVNGLAYHEIITDEEGNPVDSIFLDVNSSFENITGLRREDVIGKRLSEVKSRVIGERLDLATIIWKVALSDEPMSFEVKIPEIERWFSVSFYSPAHNEFVSILQDITQRKLIEDNQQQAANRVKFAHQLAKMGQLTWNLKTNEILWSDEVFAIYGVDKEKVKPTIEYTMSLVHPDDLAFVQENLDAAVKGTKFYDIDHRIIRPNGKIIWVHAQGGLLYDSAATPLLLLGTVIDITERKTTEQEISESKEKFRSVFDDSAMANNLYDSSGVMIALNQAAMDMFGVKRKEDLLGFKLFDDPNLPEDIKKRVLSGEKVRYVSEFNFDDVVKHALYETSKSGIIYLDTLIAPYGMKDQSSVAGYFVQMLDITDQVQMTDLLRFSEGKYRGIFDRAAFGIVLTSKDDDIIDANPMMESILGYTREELCQMKIAEFSYPDDDVIDKKFAEQLKNGEMNTFRMKKRYIKKNGDTLWANLTVSSIPDRNGQTDYFIGIVESLSESMMDASVLK